MYAQIAKTRATWPEIVFELKGLSSMVATLSLHQREEVTAVMGRWPIRKRKCGSFANLAGPKKSSVIGRSSGICERLLVLLYPRFTNTIHDTENGTNTGSLSILVIFRLRTVRPYLSFARFANNTIHDTGIILIVSRKKRDQPKKTVLQTNLSYMQHQRFALYQYYFWIANCAGLPQRCGLSVILIKAAIRLILLRTRFERTKCTR
jgi:hypothetical protein